MTDVRATVKNVCEYWGQFISTTFDGTGGYEAGPAAPVRQKALLGF